ncbi:MAG: pilin glycosylation ligase domain-containing protein, partial [Limnohabitans sp.]
MDLALLGGLAGSVLCVMVASQCTRLSRATLLRHLCWALLSAAALSSGIAGLQYSGLLHQPLEWLSWLHASPNEEAYGQLRQRNQFGSLMSLGLAAWLYLA